MSRHIWFGLGSALLTMVVTLGTALISLFSQDGVTEFGDIAQVAYATAVIGSIVAAANQIRAEFKNVDNKRDADSD